MEKQVNKTLRGAMFYYVPIMYIFCIYITMYLCYYHIFFLSPIFGARSSSFAFTIETLKHTQTKKLSMSYSKKAKGLRQTNYTHVYGCTQLACCRNDFDNRK